MTLIKYPECGKDISEYAERCPQCGCSKEYYYKKQFYFLSVHFINNIWGKTYTYLSLDPSIAKGDHVLVKASTSNEEIIAVVESVFKTTNLNQSPYPIEKIKHILRKMDDKDCEQIIISYTKIFSQYIAEKNYVNAQQFMEIFLPLVEGYAKKGNVLAQYNCGIIYENAFKNTPLAKQWYEKAAKQGNADAEYALSRLRLATKPKSLIDYENDDDAYCYDYDEYGVAYEDYPDDRPSY